MLEPTYQNSFKKDVKKALKSGKDLDKFKTLLDLLLNKKVLPARYDNHKLHGKYVDCWECKLEPDWLVIYGKSEESINFIRMGSHAELFR